MKLLKAFTLIELMVVMSIMSLLSSVVFAQISEVKVGARDVVRKRGLY
tara:strand:- start:37 stop:180 length:144 start_codon:yes stop_codon:yes gene_type:complete